MINPVSKHILFPINQIIVLKYFQPGPLGTPIGELCMEMSYWGLFSRLFSRSGQAKAGIEPAVG